MRLSLLAVAAQVACPQTPAQAGTLWQSPWSQTLPDADVQQPGLCCACLAVNLPSSLLQ